MNTTDSIAVNRTRAMKVYCDMKADGAGNVEARNAARKVHPVNVHKLNLAWYSDTRNPNCTVADPAYPALTEDQKDARVVLERAENGRSWGEIAIIADEPESRVRTRWERGSKLSSTGHRTGQGGRFAFGERDLYHGNHKSLGAELSPEELRQLRNDPELLAEYMAASDEYKSKLTIKIRSAKAKIKGQARKGKKAA